MNLKSHNIYGKSRVFIDGEYELTVDLVGTKLDDKGDEILSGNNDTEKISIYLDILSIIEHKTKELFSEYKYIENVSEIFIDGVKVDF